MLDLLSIRYPELAFLLQFTSFEQTGIEEEAPLQLEIDPKVEVLYVYGIGQGNHYSQAKKWLALKKEHALIFLEDDLAHLDKFLKGPHAAAILKDPQVHIHFVSDAKKWDVLLDELVLLYPSKRIEVVALPSYAKKRGRFFKTLSLKLFRKASSLQALFSEVLHYHKLFENLLPNFKRAPQAFLGNKLKDRFKNIPAIICGAGPSLSSSIETLRTLEHKALIFAGGSTITALSAQGIIPHFGMALDPNPEEYLRLNPSHVFENPLLYANRLLPSVFATCNGPWGYLRTDTGGIAETWIEEKLGISEEAIGPDLGNEAFSVTTMQIAFAKILGCNPIILTGVDLAFTGGNRYSPGVMKDSSVKMEELAKETRVEEKLLKRKDRFGKEVYTLVKWVMESESISAYAKAQKQVTFFNATSEGIGFKGIPYCALDEVVSTYCKKPQDLRGKVHAEIARVKMPSTVNTPHLETLLDALVNSLKRAEDFMEKILAEQLRIEQEIESYPDLESGKLLILKMDLEEEVAFDALLQQIGPVLDKMTERSLHLTPDMPHEERQKKLLQREIAKNKEILNIIRHTQTLF